MSVCIVNAARSMFEFYQIYLSVVSIVTHFAAKVTAMLPIEFNSYTLISLV